ncbi:hypothetical protein C7974DRAFT_215882 [Boeremia exigua]|uniref:uncharacterized protein n=1 Tax=Boeremia exigua TaxID=749465 RepID=UPI001E8E69CE|nr:uncharacterized protein C7974DRAFT_215882 [Boeremia exigua]KAH6622085.1 hypothetical protein C7974DRAFT_215882 [Boeremia exigua]
MGRPFRISAPQRSLYNLRYRLALVLFIFVLLEQHRFFFKYRTALAIKYSPTELPTATKQQSWVFDGEGAHYQDYIVANRAAWRALGKGWEGKTFVYQDSVIKTFTPGRSPFRNCAPGTADERWPTEIPASLYFGGSERNTTFSHDSFLPVRTFFMAPSSTDRAEWHLVTPLLKGGDLEDLTAKERKRREIYRNIDAQYRPAFTGFLRSLQVLHEAGYCHDDVKPGNVLVADSAHWILADLGNIRHLTHPYHTSLLWQENRQLSDCRANDGIRALKSYLRFVRGAAVDANAFDAEFLEGREPLSRLFWSATANATHLSVGELREQSAIEHPHRNDYGESESGALLPITSHAWLSAISRRWGRSHAVTRALQTRVGEKMARWWALTWIFGVPVTTVCGV